MILVTYYVFFVSGGKILGDVYHDRCQRLFKYKNAFVGRIIYD